MIFYSGHIVNCTKTVGLGCKHLVGNLITLPLVLLIAPYFLHCRMCL